MVCLWAMERRGCCNVRRGRTEGRKEGLFLSLSLSLSLGQRNQPTRHSSTCVSTYLTSHLPTPRSTTNLRTYAQSKLKLFKSFCTCSQKKVRLDHTYVPTLHWCRLCALGLGFEWRVMLFCIGTESGCLLSLPWIPIPRKSPTGCSRVRFSGKSIPRVYRALGTVAW